MHTSVCMCDQDCMTTMVVAIYKRASVDHAQKCARERAYFTREYAHAHFTMSHARKWCVPAGTRLGHPRLYYTVPRVRLSVTPHYEPSMIVSIPLEVIRRRTSANAASLPDNTEASVQERNNNCDRAAPSKKHSSGRADTLYPVKVSGGTPDKVHGGKGKAVVSHVPGGESVSIPMPCNQGSHRTFQCSYCSKSYNYMQSLRKHHVMKHGDLPHTKVRSVSERRIFHCSYCDCLFTRRYALCAHHRRKHECLPLPPAARHAQLNKPFKCSQCGRTYTRSGSLRRHLLLAHNDSPCIRWCSKSGTGLSGKNSLAWHRLQCCGSDKVNCVQSQPATPHKRSSVPEQISLCVNKATKKNTASSFSRRRTIPATSSKGNQRAEKFPLPDNKAANEATAFSSPALVPAMSLEPVIVETGSGRGYKCALCGRILARMASFKEHMNLHTGSRPYTCDKCHKSFQNHTQHWRHIRKEHKC